MLPSASSGVGHAHAVNRLNAAFLACLPNSPESSFSPSNAGPQRVVLSRATEQRGSSALRLWGQVLYPRRPTKLTRLTALVLLS